MTKKIFQAIFWSSVSVFVLTACLFTFVLYNNFTNAQMNELILETELTAQGVESQNMDYLESLDLPQGRVTWISEDGTVLFDSDTEAADMENHADREEVREALESGTGSSIRTSQTLMETYMYYAQKLSDGTIIRVSSSHANLVSLLVTLIQPITLMLLLVLALSWFLAYRLSRHIVKPLNSMDLSKIHEQKELLQADYEEVQPLLLKIQALQKEVDRQKVELARKKDEFDAASEAMAEGIVLLDGKNNLISANPAARRIFMLDENIAGVPFLTYCSSQVADLLGQLKTTGQVSEKIEQDGRTYSVSAARVDQNHKSAGTALLILDVTEKEKADNLRREFSANVSHELKTPLQTILSASELIAQTNMSSEDAKHFASQIHGQAMRMNRLVQDILELSSLDEGAVGITMEPFNMKTSVEQVKSAIESQAQRNGISFEFRLENAWIVGSSRLAEEIVLNLCENAVKYNKPNGTAVCALFEKDGKVFLQVSDTGIGIPAADQPRIFERFYRVDKSRSKKAGGTGLGLSIVKHAVSILGGVIRLASKPDEGTMITCEFPAYEPADK